MAPHHPPKKSLTDVVAEAQRGRRTIHAPDQGDLYPCLQLPAQVPFPVDNQEHPNKNPVARISPNPKD